MTRYSKHVAQLSAIAAAVLAGPAFAAMTTDANLELDSDYRTGVKSPDQILRPGGMSQGGRVEFNVAGKAGDANGFVAGRGTLLIKRDGSAATDDMWGQIGTGMVDVKLGRFEATDMSPPGKDTLVEDGSNAATGWRGNLLRGRTGPTNGITPFHAALTVNPGSGVGIEIGVVKTRANIQGIRPIVSFAAGPVGVKLGVETGKDSRSGAKFTGFSATVGGALEGVSFNVNLGSGKSKPIGGDIKSTTFGANATFGPAGVGFIMDTDKQGSRKDKDTVIYAAYSIPLFATGATLTPALSHQTGKSGATSLKATTAARVRLNYTF